MENNRDHEDRIWRDESQRFHQVPNFMLDPSTSSLDRNADLDCCDVAVFEQHRLITRRYAMFYQRQSGLSDEMGISAREMYRDHPGADPNLSRNSYHYGVLSDPSMMTEFSPMMNGTMPNISPTFLPTSFRS
ncbi:hypothetical protein JTE90_015155 [Oedothorax gibbosus]|uniref:Uncharacterized protein n=1 Tax=Oedothorax gibbosus TaxID=931172 RepID=A0AAV6VSA0_9ARAC|nr:hypothetical protein JTE90_015155 [Oedothorax gibbosus]